MNEEQHENHVWLGQLVGEWRCELAGLDAEGKPGKAGAGHESVRRIGELWVVTEGTGASPDAPMAHYHSTLGYDVRRGRFRGCFIGGDMSYFWDYDGEIDATRRVLSLFADGPGFEPPHAIVRYVDEMEFIGPDERILRSHLVGADGVKQPPFMQIRSWREK